MVVNLIYEQNTELKNKLLNVNPSFIKNNKVDKNNIKKLFLKTQNYWTSLNSVFTHY